MGRAEGSTPESVTTDRKLVLPLRSPDTIFLFSLRQGLRDESLHLRTVSCTKVEKVRVYIQPFYRERARIG